MISFNPLQKQWTTIRDQALQVIDRTGAEGQWILGPAVREFETALAAFWPSRFAVGCANGLDAIEIGLRCAGVGRGDKVLTSPLSAFATTLAILHVGAVPVFVDVDDQGLLDLTLCEAAFSAHPDLRYFLPVHLYGQPLNLDRLESMAARFSLTIIEDCAQAIGAEWNARRVGTVGQSAAVSFYPTKNLGALGDGGALITSDPTVAARARRIRDYGQEDRYVHTEYGLNSRLDELQAALLREVFLPRLDAATARRRQAAKRYLAELTSPGLRGLSPETVDRSAWHLFPLFVDGDRDAFRTHLKNSGVETAVHYPCAIPDQPALQNTIAADSGPLTTARWIAAHEVSLPLHPWLEEADLDQVIAACNSWRP